MSFYTDDSPGLKIPPVSYEIYVFWACVVLGDAQSSKIDRRLNCPLPLLSAGHRYCDEPRLHFLCHSAPYYWQGETVGQGELHHSLVWAVLLSCCCCRSCLPQA